MNDAELKLARERLAHTDIKLHQSMAQNLNFVADASIDCNALPLGFDFDGSRGSSVCDMSSACLRRDGIFAAIIDGDARNRTRLS